jgi:hypothetical protein
VLGKDRTWIDVRVDMQVKGDDEKVLRDSGVDLR